MMQTQTPLFQFAVVGVVATLIMAHVLSSRYHARRDLIYQGLSRYDRDQAQRGCSMLVVLLLVLLFGVGFLLLALAHQGPFSFGPAPITQVTQASSSDLLTRAPTISATHIDQVLAIAHSPAQGLGSQLVHLGQQYHIDPAFALAFFHHESTYGTRGVAPVTHSLGNIRCTPGVACYQGYRRYGSWAEGVQDWYRLIQQEYVNKGLDTVGAIIPVYAPAKGGNNVDGYVSSVMGDVTSWRREQTVSMTMEVG